MDAKKTPPLSGHWLELYEERAAIMEYDAKLPRREAEAAAWQEIRRLMRDGRDKTLF